jgi:hypothetical protein
MAMSNRKEIERKISENRSPDIDAWRTVVIYGSHKQSTVQWI